MRSRVQVLELLTRQELLDAVERYALAVADRRVKDQLVDALVTSRRAALPEVLEDLPRDRLKEICRSLDLDDSGREKSEILGRILGVESDRAWRASEAPVTTPARAPEPRRGAPQPAPISSPPGRPAPAREESRLQQKGIDSMTNNNDELGKRLWDAADELRANSKLKSSEYSIPVLGMIFLRYADVKFRAAESELGAGLTGRRRIGAADFQAKGVLYLPDSARFETLLRLPEGANLGGAINEAMKAIEAENADLKDVLPKSYNRLDNRTLVELLKLLSSIPMDIEGDAFGKIYEYFLGNFAKSEGQKGGEFFTPTSIVRLIVEILEPFHGRIFDPACGSGGMFVQSARFVEEHRKSPGSEISVYGQERVAETVRLAKMNLAVHGLAGDIRQGNTYYEDLHSSVGKFDFVLANPPFNVDRIDKDRMADDPRFPFGLPRADNGNYVWISVFYSALNKEGRAGFVMANSAPEARGSELEIRRKIIEDRTIDVMVAIGPNFFYTVTLPCTLWFLDRGKRGTPREDKVLFLDARHLFRQIDRAHRDFTPEQREFLANVVRLYRGKEPENQHDSAALLKEKFPKGKYLDVPGLCKIATIKEIEAQGWGLNPGRYVGVTDRPPDDFDFVERLEGLNEELERLNVEARELEEQIGENLARVLEGGM